MKNVIKKVLGIISITDFVLLLGISNEEVTTGLFFTVMGMIALLIVCGVALSSFYDEE